MWKQRVSPFEGKTHRVQQGYNGADTDMRRKG